MGERSADRSFSSILFICFIGFIIGQCIDNRHNQTEMMYSRTNFPGQLLACENNIGLTMCIDTCTKLGGCSHVNFNREKLSCALMTNNASITCSDLREGGISSQMKEAIGNIFVLMNNFTIVCGTKVCREGYTCIESASGKKACLPVDKHCCDDRYLVTGPYGVTSDRVTFSSIYHPTYVQFRLDVPWSWASIESNTNEWIQVMFLSRKLVKGVITQGSGVEGMYQWVTSYHVQFVACDERWEYVRDALGNIVTFPGNTDKNTKISNYFPRAISTNGIRLRPQTWKDFIEMRFDVLGC